MATFTTRLIPVASLRCRRPLRGLDAAAKEALMHSISERGLLQPITVRQDGEWFEVLNGMHRWQAYLSLGREEIPATVLEGVDDDAEGLLSALEINLVGRDMSPIDKARGMEQWLQVAELRQADIARRLGVSEAKVSKMLSLRRLPAALQELVHSGALAETVAYDLLRRYSDDELEAVALELMSGGLTSKQVVAKLSARSKRKPVSKVKKLRCQFSLHLAGGRFVGMAIPNCASVEELKACLRDAIEEVSCREARGARLSDFGSAAEGPSGDGEHASGGDDAAA